MVSDWALQRREGASGRRAKAKAKEEEEEGKQKEKEGDEDKQSANEGWIDRVNKSEQH